MCSVTGLPLVMLPQVLSAHSFGFCFTQPHCFDSFSTPISAVYSYRRQKDTWEAHWSWPTDRHTKQLAGKQNAAVSSLRSADFPQELAGIKTELKGKWKRDFHWSGGQKHSSEWMLMLLYIYWICRQLFKVIKCQCCVYSLICCPQAAMGN